MAKIQNISEIHPVLGFTEFDVLEKYLDHAVSKGDQRKNVEQVEVHLCGHRKTALQYAGALSRQIDGLSACKQRR